MRSLVRCVAEALEHALAELWSKAIMRLKQRSGEGDSHCRGTLHCYSKCLMAADASLC